MKKQKFTLKKYLPRAWRRTLTVHKIMKSVHKHQKTYLKAIHSVVYTVGQFFKTNR